MMALPLARWLTRHFRRALRDQRANVMFEFAIAMPFMVAMVVGSFAVGLMFDRLLTEGQLARNAANMFARGVKFNTTGNKTLLINAAPGMDLKLDGTGKSVVYLSLLTRVSSTANCTSGGSTVACGNRGLIVVAQRFIIGNTSVHASDFATIAAANIDSDGNVNNYMHQSYARATVPSPLNDSTNGIVENQLVYAAEVYHQPTLIQFPGIFAPEMMRAWAYY